jgi:antitoxin component YwqK of YwqJK toxin-antitoxin module
MKKILLFLILIPSTLIGQSNQVIDTVTTSQLLLKGDLAYKIDTNKPFTGVRVETLPNGEKYSEEHFVNGSISLAKTFNNDTIFSIAEYSPESLNKLTYYFKSGIKRFERIYDKASRVTSETTWNSDGSKKDEKIYPSAHPMPGIMISLPDEREFADDLVAKDTLKEDEYLAYAKGNNEPFTGVVTFSGQLNFNRSKRGIFIPHDSYVSAATFVSGMINGKYTTWYVKNGNKKSELTVTGERARIKENGPFTQWYPNGQIAATGILKNGQKSGNKTTWYENGQIKSEAYYNNGKPFDKSMTWDETGQNSIESVYYQGAMIKKIWRGKNGQTEKEWPEVDEDNYGLRRFIDDFLSILKAEDYDALKNLFASKEDYITIKLRNKGKEPSNKILESINASWDENVSEKINDIKDQLREHNPIEMLGEYNVFYSYELIKENNASQIVSWPNSINYDISAAISVATKIAITHKQAPFKLELTPYFLNNKWCFIATDSSSVVQVTY